MMRKRITGLLALLLVLVITVPLPVRASIDQSIYDNMEEADKSFLVYVGGAGNQSVQERLDMGQMLYAQTEATADSAVGTDTIRSEVEADNPYYQISQWKVWAVNDSGVIAGNGSLVTEASDVLDASTDANFISAANWDASNSAVIRPVLEAVLSAIDYTIPVYEADGQSSGQNLILNVENYEEVSFPTDVKAEAWKLVYNDTEEYAVTSAADIWNEVIAKKGTDFDDSLARLCAVVSDREGTASFTQPGWYVGESMPAPVISSDTNGTDHVTYYYKAAGADDSTYAATAPTEAGSYTAKAVFAASGGYSEVVKTSDFTISYLPAPEDAYSISGFLGSNGWYSGAVTITPKSGYRIRSEESGVWSDRVSVTDSRNVVVYLMSESGAMTQALTVGEIKVDQTAPVFDGEGDGIVIGGSRWNSLLNTIRFGLFPDHAQTVTIQAHDPESGIANYEYLVSAVPLNLTQLQNSQGWSSGSSFTMSPAAAQEQIVYARVTNQAGLVSYISSDGIVYDSTAPLIRGASDGGSYYGDELTVTVTDDYLRTVTVNGEAVAVSNNRAVLTLEASDREYTVTAADYAGNQTVCRVRIQETWLRDGITSSGIKRLSTGMEYKLGRGQWKVGGDDTVYAGGSSFYVKEDGEYDFRLQ